jgi:hypothetical protein
MTGTFSQILGGDSTPSGGIMRGKLDHWNYLMQIEIRIGDDDGVN